MPRPPSYPGPEVPVMASEKHPLQKLLEEAGHETRSYSGRGMYGNHCLGVEVSDVGDLVGSVVEQLGEEEDPGYETIALAFRTMRTDGMGLDVIVYFTGVPYVEDFWSSTGAEEDAEYPDAAKDTAAS